ncbi:hypothetical protein FJT64_009259 [Amphibalanus amphitrite]|uniref:Uncharacterized protein n=1 Tax=Amphibalanus amphitrite TaxID=1232801 RepID=A0A6A4VQ64_AMPAM|nr:hypothetical protein FJT64_009259 [Amphibalanus amphitrite]
MLNCPSVQVDKPPPPCQACFATWLARRRTKAKEDAATASDDGFLRLRKIFDQPEVVAALDRTKCSSNTGVAVAAAILKSGGADLSQFSVSKTTVNRARSANRELTAERVREEFQLHKPKHAALHWDSKLVRTVTRTKEDRLAVLVSGAPHYKEGKLLGIPPMEDEDGKPTSTGSAQFQYVKELIVTWNVKDNIRAVSFDTTASNTGIFRGVATRMEAFLNRRVLWLACRHHVHELVQRALQDLLFEKDKGPENEAYLAVKNMWSSLDTGPAASFKKLVFRSPVLLKMRDEAVKYLKEVLCEHSDQVLLRDDYDELARTSLSVLLGEIPPGGTKWMKPGASHKARFMADVIYTNKMYAFHASLGYDKATIAALRRVVQLNRLLVAVGDVLNVPHDKVDVDGKSRLAARLQTFRVPDDFELGVPDFPDVDEGTELVDLLGPNSWTLFMMLETGTSWLQSGPETWSEDPDYQETAAFVTTVKVTNDVAERGVKLVTFANKVARTAYCP